MIHYVDFLAVLLSVIMFTAVIVQAVKTRRLKNNNRHRSLEAVKILLWSILWLVLSVALAWVVHTVTGKKASAVVSASIITALFVTITVAGIIKTLQRHGRL